MAAPMHKRPTTLRKVFTVFTGLLLVVQSLTPGFFISSRASAQNETVTETPAPTPVTTPQQSQPATTNTPEPTQVTPPMDSPIVEPTTNPTEIYTPTPTQETSPTDNPTPSLEPTTEPTIEPTLELSPTTEPTTSATPTETTEQPKETSPPGDNGNSNNQNTSANTFSSPTTTIEPSASPTTDETPSEKGELKTTILKNIKSQTLDLDGVNPDGSAKLTTDKADYAPTDAAIITGTGFNQNTTYELTVSSADNPATSTTVTITTGPAGNFVYAYQLDGTYRPNYQVFVLNEKTDIVATITFTDGPTKPPVDVENCKYNCTAKDIDTISFSLVKNDGTPLSCSYGSATNAYIKVSYNNHTSGRYAAYLMGEIWQGGTKIKNINAKNACLDTMVNGTNTYVFDPQFSWTCGESVEIKNLIIAWDTNTNTCNNFFNQDACNPPAQSFCGGSVGYIVVTPLVSNFSADSVCAGNVTTFTDATTGGTKPYSYSWNFGDTGTSTSSSPTHQYPAAGTYQAKLSVTDSSNPSQTNEITHTVTVNQCTGTLTVIKHVDNTGGGTKTASDFQLTASGTSNPSPASFAGAETPGTNITLSAGSYSITEPSHPGYAMSTSGDCTGTFSPTSPKTCTVTNTYIPVCGDGVKYGSEQCDNGTQNGLVCTPPYGTNGQPASCSYCDTSCHTVTLTDGYCGDNIVNDASEQCDGTAGVPTNYTCSSTCTLIRNTGNVTFVKAVDYGPGTSGDWTFSVTDGAGGLVGDTYVSGHTYTLDTGIYQIGETTTLRGYSFYGATGICSVNPTNGHVDMNVTTSGSTCTITNHRDMGSVLLHKNIDINGDGDWTDTNETSDTFADSNGFSYNFYGGARSYGVSLTGIPTTTSYASYPISENMPDTYHFSGWFNTNEMGRSCTNPNGTSMPTELEVNKNATTEITLCNTRNTGTLQVLKDVDLNGDGDYTDPGETGVTDWQWQYNNGSDHATGDTLTVPTGTYALSETDKPGFHMERLSCVGGALNLSTVTIGTGANVVCTFGNARDVGSVNLTKIIDADGDLTTTNDQTPGGTWQFDITGTSTDTNTATSQYTGADGTTTFTRIKTGTYNIGETAQDGYTLVSASCSSGSRDGDTIYGIQVTRGNETTCTFYNTPNGTIHGYKWNDEDQSGGPSAGDTEPLLSGWNIDLYRWNGEGFDTEPVSSMTTSDGTAHFGWYWFEHLVPGTYKVCEEPKTGWTQTFPVNQTDNCHIVNLPDDNSYDFPTGENYVSGPEYNFGNRFVTPELQISKTNNAGGDLSPGANVTYTIHLNVLKNNAYGVKVTDLVPQGFTFTGTWSATKNGNPMTVSAPTYHSPGTWDLGNLEKGDEIILTMDTTVSNDQKPGLYKDLAYAYGCEQEGTCAITDEQAVVAQAVSPGNLDANFVGTDVNIVTNQQESKTLSVVTSKTEEGSVLGASTELPSTGADTDWVIFATMLIMTGIGSICIGRRYMRRYHA